jgi:TRAP-type mannitol/chloroaromatic compound transport system permease small subunit
MYLVFVMIGVLMYSCIARTVFNLPLIWSVEFSQFVLSGYYLLGGAYVMLLKGHVRMDLFYTKWSPKRQAAVDIVTDFCLITYLVILLVGAVLSIDYALEYGQRARSAWAPPMAPIKIVMGVGVLLMLLQSIATLFKDIARARGKPLHG